MADIELKYTELFDLEQRLIEENAPYFVIERGTNKILVNDRNFISSFKEKIHCTSCISGVPRDVKKKINNELSKVDRFLKKDNFNLE